MCLSVCLFVCLLVSPHVSLSVLLCLCSQDLTNIDLFLASREVEEALQQKDTSKCLAWCNDNKSRLKKMKVITAFLIT